VNKGRWAIVIVVLVALGMGVATWPLLRIRRRNEIHKMEALLEALRSECQHYNIKYGAYPASLMSLDAMKGRQEIMDVWGRPIRYELVLPSGKPRLWSLGPDENNPSDDIGP
jgi:hypothetical protein